MTIAHIHIHSSPQFPWHQVPPKTLHTSPYSIPREFSYNKYLPQNNHTYEYTLFLRPFQLSLFPFG